MIDTAVRMRVREAADLDWKLVVISADEKSGPGKQKVVEERRWEFAKDVAAMANTQGGLIVYGVHDVKEEADHIEPVPLGERERQRLSSWANTMVRPWLKGLTIEDLPALGGGTEGLLVVSVQASSDAPHVVEDRDKMLVPYRDGAHTRWMSEYQLERAYRERFARKTREDAALDEQLEDVRVHLDLEGSAWLVVCARPTSSLPQLGSAVPSRDSVAATVLRALKLPDEIYSTKSGRHQMLRQLGSSAAENPRPGLRRWTTRDNVWAPAEALGRHIHLELHHDGACTVAFAIQRWLQAPDFREFWAVPVPYVGSAIVDTIALISAHARNRGHLSEMMIRAELLRSG